MAARDARDVRLSYSSHGLQQATLRCEAAHWHRPEDTFVAAAEAVSWVVALDEALAADAPDWDGKGYKQSRNESDDGRTVIGMRFVRDHVHHADELQPFIYLNAVVGNSEHGFRAGWLWTDLNELLPFLDPAFTSGRGLYESHLSGHDVVHTLLNANRWFSSLSPALPDLPPDETGTPREAFALPVRWPPFEDERRA
jgi:hypothetical protein